MSYLVGDQIQPEADFGADQGSVTATVREPDGTLTGFAGGEVTHDDVGVYHVDFTASQTGEHEWAFTGDTRTIEGRFSVEASLVDDPPDELQDGALCSLTDLVARVPGYTVGADPELDQVLAELILQESEDFVEACGREIVAMNDDATRVFDLTSSVVARRQRPIGDAATVDTVELFDYDEQTSLGVIDPGLYVLLPRVRRAWAPFTRIVFPNRPFTGPVLLAPGRTIRITGTWGFPSIPKTVRRAVAVFVIFRYINDVAPAGTALGELADKADFNLAASLRAAMDTRDRLNRGPFA